VENLRQPCNHDDVWLELLKKPFEIFNIFQSIKSASVFFGPHLSTRKLPYKKREKIQIIESETSLRI